jgi:hypothetical protein
MSDSSYTYSNQYDNTSYANDKNTLTYLNTLDLNTRNNTKDFESLLFPGVFQELIRKYSDNTLESSDKQNQIYNANDIETVSDCDSIRRRSNTYSYKKQKIFHIRKISYRKNKYNEEYQNRILRQLRNRMAAKRFRENKKYIETDLMKKLRQNEEELMKYKQMYEMSKVIFSYLGYVS